MHAQDHIHIVSEGEAESVLLAKCGYGIALLPEFFIEPQDGIVCVPIAGTKNIQYGIFYKNKEKYIRTFINNYIKTLDVM